jgi:hypothetical protein
MMNAPGGWPGLAAKGDPVPLEVGLWRVDGSEPIKITSGGVPMEAQLERMIEADPTILGTPLLLIGRQVTTDYGKLIDLLAVDEDGTLHILELKRERTTREVVAQLLDYGSWVRDLTDAQVRDIYAAYRPGQVIEQAWSDTFGGNPPDELNASHTLTVVASDLDPATERIVAYLAGMNVPINVVFFRYFEDHGRSYLARTWLLDEARVAARSVGAGRSGGQEAWNEQDWYVSFGEVADERNWEDARAYGFVSAGGAEWFSRTIRKLPVGARVFTCIPKTGYVGVGTVTGAAARVDQAVLTADGVERPFASLPLKGTYIHPALPNGEDNAEYVVPVLWHRTRSREDAFWVKGMFANQNSACKLRNRFTLDQLAPVFGLDEVGT